MYSENMVRALNEIAHRYGDIMGRSIQEVLNDPKYRNTGAGASSVKINVVDGDLNTSPRVEITFDDHLIVLNKRRVEWTRLPNMKGLLAWAETKTPSEKEATQLAWAVAWDKKKNDTWKAKPWRKKSLSEVLKEMNELMVKEFDAAIEKDFQQAVKI